MKPFLKALLLPLLASLALAGCATIRDSSRDRDLQRTLHSYENAVRWGELANLKVFLKADLQPKEGAEPKYDNVRITGYKVVQGGVISEEGSVAISKARINYVLQDRQAERSLVDDQHWEFDEELGEWRRSNPLPKFK